MNLNSSLLFLSYIFSSSEPTRKNLRDNSVSASAKGCYVNKPKERLEVITLPFDILSSISHFLNQENEKNVFRNLSSKDLNHQFIHQALETSKHFFS